MDVETEVFPKGSRSALYYDSKQLEKTETHIAEHVTQLLDKFEVRQLEQLIITAIHCTLRGEINHAVSESKLVADGEKSRDKLNKLAIYLIILYSKLKGDEAQVVDFINTIIMRLPSEDIEAVLERIIEHEKHHAGTSPFLRADSLGDRLVLRLTANFQRQFIELIAKDLENILNQVRQYTKKTPDADIIKSLKDTAGHNALQEAILPFLRNILDTAQAFARDQHVLRYLAQLAGSHWDSTIVDPAMTGREAFAGYFITRFVGKALNEGNISERFQYTKVPPNITDIVVLLGIMKPLQTLCTSLTAQKREMSSFSLLEREFSSNEDIVLKWETFADEMISPDGKTGAVLAKNMPSISDEFDALHLTIKSISGADAFHYSSFDKLKYNLYHFFNLAIEGALTALDKFDGKKNSFVKDAQKKLLRLRANTRRVWINEIKILVSILASIKMEGSLVGTALVKELGKMYQFSLLLSQVLPSIQPRVNEEYSALVENFCSVSHKDPSSKDAKSLFERKSELPRQLTDKTLNFFIVKVQKEISNTVKLIESYSNTVEKSGLEATMKGRLKQLQSILEKAHKLYDLMYESKGALVRQECPEAHHTEAAKLGKT